jgi:AraC family transcriptional regulator
MNYRIARLPAKTFVGKQLTMSLANNRTVDLWRSFMPFRKQILHTLGPDLYSLQVYPPYYFHHYNPAIAFTKWAAVEVESANNLPAEMEVFNLPAGMYAVFVHKGSQLDHSTFNYIFSTWLPASIEYQLDDRPHFELLGEKYRRDDPASEEEIWIPVKVKE